MEVKTATRGKRMSATARREQILDAVGTIVAADGFEAVSIQAVAARAGISRPIVYEHFGDLDGLLEALVARETAAALAQVNATRLPDLAGDDPTEPMLASLGAFLAAVESHPDTWRLVLMPVEGAPPSLRRSIEVGRAGVLEGLASAVRTGLRPGGADPPDPELTASVLSAISDEYGRLILADPERYSRQRLLDHARWILERLTA